MSRRLEMSAAVAIGVVLGCLCSKVDLVHADARATPLATARAGCPSGQVCGSLKTLKQCQDNVPCSCPSPQCVDGQFLSFYKVIDPDAPGTCFIPFVRDECGHVRRCSNPTNPCSNPAIHCLPEFGAGITEGGPWQDWQYGADCTS